MSRINHLKKYKYQLEERYNNLIEKAENFKYIDETVSDLAAFKAFKVLLKLEKINYLDKESTFTS